MSNTQEKKNGKATSKHVLFSKFIEVNELNYRRLHLAIKKDQMFKVIIVLPVYPAGDLTLSSTRYIIKHGNEYVTQNLGFVAKSKN